VIYAVLMNPYPYAAPEGMVHMLMDEKSGTGRGFGLTAPQWQVLKQSPVVEDAVAIDGWSLTVTGHDLPEDVEAAFFTSNGFNFFGLPPPENA
jgi:hypothetical protein